MIVLTPSERRGAWIVALLLLIGACYDLLRARAVPGRAITPASMAGAADSVVPPAARPNGFTADSGTRLDLNRATASELDALPGIGPVLAARIVEHRERHGPFQRTDDLLAVPGIGPALFARLEPHVTVAAPAH